MEKLSQTDILDYCAAAMFIINTDHKVTRWNIACEELTGIAAGTVIGTDKHWQAFYDNPRPCLADLIIDDQCGAIFEHYKTAGRSPLLLNGWHAEGWFQNLGGKLRYLIFDAAPILDSNGELVAAIETLQDITERKHIEEKNAALAEGLQAALNNIKILRGLLPICASCKKIRDDQGYWNQMEAYISKHSEVLFSHGICPECAKKLYADLDLYKKKRE